MTCVITWLYRCCHCPKHRVLCLVTLPRPWPPPRFLLSPLSCLFQIVTELESHICSWPGSLKMTRVTFLSQAAPRLLNCFSSLAHESPRTSPAFPQAAGPGCGVRFLSAFKASRPGEPQPPSRTDEERGRGGSFPRRGALRTVGHPSCGQATPTPWPFTPALAGPEIHALV